MYKVSCQYIYKKTRHLFLNELYFVKFWFLPNLRTLYMYKYRYICVNIHIYTYLEPSRTSAMKRFCEKRKRLLVVGYFCKKGPTWMFDWVLNTSLT